MAQKRNRRCLIKKVNFVKKKNKIKKKMFELNFKHI